MKNYFSGKNLKWGGFIVSLFLVFYLFQNFLSPASLISINPMDYIQISHVSSTFSKNDVLGDEIFYALPSIKATWVKNFFLFSLAREARTTFSIEAQNKTTRSREILNPAYAVDIKSIPKKKGEYFQFEDKIPLQFPQKSESGEYRVVVNAVKAEVKFIFLGWINLTNYLPEIGSIGVVKYSSI